MPPPQTKTRNGQAHLLLAGLVLLAAVLAVLHSLGFASIPGSARLGSPWLVIAGLVLLGTAASFRLPVEPIFITLGIDELMDMGRTPPNVIDNCLATVVVARWEKVFGKETLSAVAQEALTD